MAKRSRLGGLVPHYSDSDDDRSAREPESFGVDFLETGITPSIRRGGGKGGVPYGYLLAVFNLLSLGTLASIPYGKVATASERMGGAFGVPTTLFALCVVQIVLKLLNVPVLRAGIWQLVITIALALYFVLLFVRIR